MAKPPVSKLADAYQTYPTADAAAGSALRGITKKVNENGGGILYNKEQNAYAATEPVGQSDGSHFAAAVSVPPGWTLHSTYHTHPSGPRSTMFSGDDIDTAKQLKVPSYVLAYDDNKIRMFDPTSSKVGQDSSFGKFSSKDSRFSYGTPVNEAPPTLPPPAQSAVAATPAPAQAPPIAGAPAASTTVPVTGSRITMKNFASKHRTQTTQYKHKIVHIKSGAPKRP